MSDRIAILDRGRCAQCDEPETLYRRPRSTFVARFFRGCNVLEISDLSCTGGGVGSASQDLKSPAFLLVINERLDRMSLSVPRMWPSGL